MLALLAALALSVDGGVASSQAMNAKVLLPDFLRLFPEASASARQEQLATLTAAIASATGAERALLERLRRLLEAERPVEQLVPELTDILRVATRQARGNFEAEQTLASAWLSLPYTSSNAGLDPAPVRREALVMVRDLVARYPREASAHALLASALLGPDDSQAGFDELKRCVELGGTPWCSEAYAQVLAERSRPKCSGQTLKRPLTATGARLRAANQPGRTVEANGETYSLEAKPFLRSADFASVSVDAAGNLELVVTAPARARLEAETRRLAGQTVVLELGDEVLLAAMVQQRISNGRLRVTSGLKGPFALADLCVLPAPQHPGR